MTAGYLDVSEYNDGHRGGKVRARAKISLTINIPYYYGASVFKNDK
jgi:hypothetical protein